MTENTKLQKVEQQLLDEKNVSDSVLNKVRVLENQGNLELPANYSPSNAMKQAWLTISQDKKLMDTSDTSKANALLDMVTQGLNPAKKQAYFIPYGNKMQLQRSVHGNVMLLKRDAGTKDITFQPIYEGDDFTYEIDENGYIVNPRLKQKFGNINKDKIVGGYATIIFDNKQNHIEVMTIDQIEQAWMQSSMIKDRDALKRSKTHNNFKEEMARKTVINRAAKRYINTSTDEGLLKFAQEADDRQRKEVFDADVEEGQASEILDIPDDFEDAEIQEVPAHDKETGEVKEQNQEENPFANADQASFDDDQPF
ncbi:RecT family recombinase [Lacicoccus qingdaonensis]|uniref:Recombination protein RecT n=1 Tax=Lacicoccus qingdaonensis TaxID=576118 RepID=A0A1G9EZU6_9BACL|nr:RecT family recombinase [Salinicoccus qingdaonensis]SDK81709.1 recombination protein RecT [Salinicoccus qingdaonensis]